MDAKKFGAFISERRKEQHMTQAGLAGKIGVTDKAVSRWERGLGFPDINTMEPLATALGVSLLELMKSEIISEEVQMKKDESAEKKYTSAEVTEMMYSMEEIRKQQQRQDKIAGYLAIPVMLIVLLFLNSQVMQILAVRCLQGFWGLAPLSAYIIFGRIEKIRKAEKFMDFLQLL